MVQFFTMVFNGITIVIHFFLKFTTFSNSASVLSNIRLIGRKTLYIALIAAFVAYIVVLVAFFYFMIDSIITAFNLIANLIQKIQTFESGNGESSSPIVQGALYFINVSGLANAVNAVFPFFAAALTFRLLKALYQTILSVHWKLLNFYRVTIDGITAA